MLSELMTFKARCGMLGVSSWMLFLHKPIQKWKYFSKSAKWTRHLIFTVSLRLQAHGKRLWLQMSACELHSGAIITPLALLMHFENFSRSLSLNEAPASWGVWTCGSCRRDEQKSCFWTPANIRIESWHERVLSAFKLLRGVCYTTGFWRGTRGKL